MTLLQTATLELGDNILTVKKLSFNEALPVYCRFQKLMSGFFDEAKEAAKGIPIFQAVGMAGALSYDELQSYIDAFGPATSCQFPDGRVLALKKVAATKTQPAIDPMSEVFSGNLVEMFQWLDFCAQYNFGDVIEKISGALAEPSAPKAKPTDE